MIPLGLSLWSWRWVGLSHDHMLSETFNLCPQESKMDSAGQHSFLLCSLLCFCIQVSCTGGTSSDPASGAVSQVRGNQPPVIKSARILNNPLSLASPAGVQIDAEDPEREAVSFQYLWYVNDVALANQTHPTLAPEHLRRGQMVSVEVIPADGTQKGKVFRTEAVTVGNTPPSVTSVTLAPLTAQPGERVEAQAEASDPDHDRTDLSYRWFRNAAMVKEGEAPFLDTTGFAARDQIVVEVTAYDPAVTGNMLRSAPVTLGNRLPKIVSVPPAPGAGDQYVYAVNAVDPDGDRMAFQLETAPPGMMINEQSGQIVWPILPSNQNGTFHVKVVAKDGQGGAAFQEFDLTFSVQAPAKPAGA